MTMAANRIVFIFFIPADNAEVMAQSRTDNSLPVCVNASLFKPVAHAKRRNAHAHAVASDRPVIMMFLSQRFLPDFRIQHRLSIRVNIIFNTNPLLRDPLGKLTGPEG
jgi:hypothetical protein